MGIGTQGGSGAKKGNHFGDGGGAVGVGEVATLGGFHYIPAPPEVVKGLIHSYLANAMLVCQFDTAVNRLVGNSLAELLVTVPYLGSGKTAGYTLDGGGGVHPPCFEPKRSSRCRAFNALWVRIPWRVAWAEKRERISVPLYQIHGRYRPVRPIGYGYLPEQYKKYLRSSVGKGLGDRRIVCLGEGLLPIHREDEVACRFLCLPADRFIGAGANMGSNHTMGSTK